MTPDAKDNATVPTVPAVEAALCRCPEYDPEPDCDSLRARRTLTQYPTRVARSARVQAKVQRSLSYSYRGSEPPESARAPCLLVFTVTSDTHGFTHSSLTLKTYLQ